MPSTLLASQRNPVRILNQVRMRHSQSRKLTLLVEGPSDRKFFSTGYVRSSCVLNLCRVVSKWKPFGVWPVSNQSNPH